MTERRATPDSVSAKVDRANLLWSNGKRRGALESLKTAVRVEPAAMELRRALAALYRGLGCPDQAGRWGIAIEGWATPLEKDRLARLLVASGVVTEDVAAFLALPADVDAFEELSQLMEGPVEAYREQLGFDATDRTVERSDLFADIAENAWITTIIASILGLIAVFLNTVLGLGDAAGFARFIGLTCAALAGLSLIANSAESAVNRHPARSAVLGVCALLLTGASLFGLVALLFA